jgi:hypothetical protein
MIGDRGRQVEALYVKDLLGEISRCKNPRVKLRLNQALSLIRSAARLSVELESKEKKRIERDAAQRAKLDDEQKLINIRRRQIKDRAE